MIAFGISVLYFCGGLLGLAILFVASIWFIARLRDFADEQWQFYRQPGNRWKGVVVGTFFVLLAADAVWFVGKALTG